MKNQIINTDSLAWLKSIKPDTFDHCITSPPYNMNLRLHGSRYSKRKIEERTKYTHYHDALSIDEYFQWQQECILEMLRVTKGLVFYNIQMVTGNKPALFQLFGHFAFQIKEILIWDKKVSVPAISESVLNSDFEFIIVFSKNKSISRMFDTSNWTRGTLSNVLRIGKNKQNENTEHSASMPFELPFKLIQNFTDKSDWILDPFGGCGTVGQAAKQLKRNYTLVEIDKSYCEQAQNNIWQTPIDMFA